MLPRESNPLEETFDPEGMAVLGGISYQMDWGQCKQKRPTLSFLRLVASLPQHAAGAPGEYSFAA
jgi:hypothetical protein